MNFPVNPAPSGDDTRIKVVKKADLAARHEAYQSHLDHEAALAAAAAPAIAQGAAHLHAPVAPPMTIPAGPPADPQVQLVQVEKGVYDIYFTCSCGGQYVIRCESLEKAAE